MKKKYHYYLEEAHKINFNEGLKQVALVGATILKNEQLRQERLRKEKESKTKNQENEARQDSENRRNEKIERQHEEQYDADYDIIKKNFKNGKFLNNINLESVLFDNKYPSKEIKTIKGTKEVDEIINNFNTKINNLFNQLSKIYLTQHSNITKNGKTTTPEEKIESMKKSIDFELTNIFSDLQFTAVKSESKKHIIEKILDKWRKTKGKIYFNNFTIELKENEDFIKEIIASNNGPRSNNCDNFSRHLHSSLIFHPLLLTFKQFKSLVDNAKTNNTLEHLFMPINSRNQRALGLNDYKDGRSDFKKISEIFQKFKNNKEFDKIVELMKQCETELGI